MDLPVTRHTRPLWLHPTAGERDSHDVPCYVDRTPSRWRPARPRGSTSQTRGHRSGWPKQYFEGPVRAIKAGRPAGRSVCSRQSQRRHQPFWRFRWSGWRATGLQAGCSQDGASTCGQVATGPPSTSPASHVSCPGTRSVVVVDGLATRLSWLLSFKRRVPRRPLPEIWMDSWRSTLPLSRRKRVHSGACSQLSARRLHCIEAQWDQGRPGWAHARDLL